MPIFKKDHAVTSMPSRRNAVSQRIVAREPVTDEQKKATADFAQIVLSAVRDEDYAIGAGVQAGLSSNGNRSFTFGRNEPAVQHFHRMVAQFMEHPNGTS